MVVDGGVFFDDDGADVGGELTDYYGGDGVPEGVGEEVWKGRGFG